MMRWIALLSTLGSSWVWANCDVHQFRWACDRPAAISATSTSSYVVFCHDLPVFVNQETYHQVMQYHAVDVNMDLWVDGEFVTGPCLPGGLADVRIYSKWSHDHAVSTHRYK